MAETNTRIEQFRKMANDDPNNALAHFSLGREYLNAGMFGDAVASFRRVLEIDGNITKAYHLLGTALLKDDKRDEAIGVLTAGVRRAHERGDMMPKNEMSRMLKDLGAAVPELEAKAPERAPSAGEVQCRRCNQVKPKIASPPFRNAFGQEIYEKICADCWREAIGYGTKVINELRLPLADPQAQKMWDQHIREFLNLQQAEPSSPGSV